MNLTPETMMHVDLRKLRVLGDSLVYDGALPDCQCNLVDGRGKRYALLLDLNAEASPVIKRLLTFYQRHSVSLT